MWIDKDEDESYTARHECSFVQAGDRFYLFGGRKTRSVALTGTLEAGAGEVASRSQGVLQTA